MTHALVLIGRALWTPLGSYFFVSMWGGGASKPQARRGVGGGLKLQVKAVGVSCGLSCGAQPKNQWGPEPV